MTFPLHNRPAVSYKDSPRRFGAARGNGRKHAGCDLYAPAGSLIMAMQSGVVLGNPYLFYDVVYAVEVQHADGSICRYGEIAADCPLKKDDSVLEGQPIARVGKMQHVKQSMLHLEWYAGTATGPLTDRRKPPFMRRADLTDPTPILDSAQLAMMVTDVELGQ